MSTDSSDDPLAMFHALLEEATRKEPNDPTAMTVATATADGIPSARMVLLKEADPRGFVFYTNTQSRKGDELESNPRAALVFHWKSMRRQIRVEGTVERVTDAEADAYFASRARGSQVGAWASEQSRPMDGRFDLEKRVARFAARFGVGSVPRPPHWTGYRVVPSAYEFWTDKPFRLHERIRFDRAGDGWAVSRLFP
ncbi:MAG: pyridoxamine 5'-phosphate oxidase [Rhodospirillales bacterium]